MVLLLCLHAVRVKGSVLFSEQFALHEPQSMVYGIQHTTDLPAHSFPHSPLCSDNPAACGLSLCPIEEMEMHFLGWQNEGT